MAEGLPPHEWSTLTKKLVVFIDGHKYTWNKTVNKDGEERAYFYCVDKRKFGCKASAQGVKEEGNIYFKFIYGCASYESRYACTDFPCPAV